MVLIVMGLDVVRTIKMNWKSLGVVVCGLFVNNVHAGFFDSNKASDFKCGREDVVLALTSAIRDNALTHAYDSVGEIANLKGVMASTKINASEVTTTKTVDNELTCSATVSFGVLPSLQVVADSVPVVYDDFIKTLKNDYRAIYDGNSVTWKDVTYTVRLADNNKDISVKLSNVFYPAYGLEKYAELDANKVEVIKANDPATLVSAKAAYEQEDAKLNQIWKAIPPSFRSSLKDQQVSWIWSKDETCGRIQDTALTSLTISQKVSIFECQTKLTKERISFLGGAK
ncbi:MAG: lysozyme inhibitor LprI family protein [Plesiomonas shigelloides]